MAGGELCHSGHQSRWRSAAPLHQERHQSAADFPGARRASTTSCGCWPHVRLDPEEQRLVNAYMECFNQRDWDALRRLIRANARVEIVGVTELHGAEIGTRYATNYGALPYERKLALARVDGEPLIVHWRKVAAEWHPVAAVKVWWRDGQVIRVRDYVHVDYLLRYARTELEQPAASAG